MEDTVQLNPTSCTRLVFGCTDSKPQSHKLITVCIHGDETCGFHAINELISEGFFRNGFDTQNERVTVILGNPRAFVESKRFVHINLNRIFTHQFIQKSAREDFFGTDKGGAFAFSNGGSEVYELSRLSEIVEAMKECDCFLDLHSTSAHTSPFAIVTPGETSEAIAKTFPVRFILHNVVKVISGTSIDYVDSLNKPAICVECGQHQDSATIQVAKETIRAFICGASPMRIDKQVLFVDRAEILREGFRFCSEVKAFSRVEYNELVAKDNVIGELRCPYERGAFLIMPVANPVVGEEAWLWGHTHRSLRKSAVHG
jgi:succinylglutamate desuccinylase